MTRALVSALMVTSFLYLFHDDDRDLRVRIYDLIGFVTALYHGWTAYKFVQRSLVEQSGKQWQKDYERAISVLGVEDVIKKFLQSQTGACSARIRVAVPEGHYDSEHGFTHVEHDIPLKDNPYFAIEACARRLVDLIARPAAPRTADPLIRLLLQGFSFKALDLHLLWERLVRTAPCERLAVARRQLAPVFLSEYRLARDGLERRVKASIIVDQALQLNRQLDGSDAQRHAAFQNDFFVRIGRDDLIRAVIKVRTDCMARGIWLSTLPAMCELHALDALMDHVRQQRDLQLARLLLLHADVRFVGPERVACSANAGESAQLALARLRNQALQDRRHLEAVLPEECMHLPALLDAVEKFDRCAMDRKAQRLALAPLRSNPLAQALARDEERQILSGMPAISCAEDFQWILSMVPRQAASANRAMEQTPEPNHDASNAGQAEDLLEPQFDDNLTLEV